MIKLFFNSNQKTINAIAAKIINVIFKKSLKLNDSKVEIKDFTIIDGCDGALIIHLNGEIKTTKEELLNFINNKLPD